MIPSGLAKLKDKCQSKELNLFRGLCPYKPLLSFVSYLPVCEDTDRGTLTNKHHHKRQCKVEQDFLKFLQNDSIRFSKAEGQNSIQRIKSFPWFVSSQTTFVLVSYLPVFEDTDRVTLTTTDRVK